MRSLVKVMLVLAILFASTFVVLNSTGVVTVEKIENWLEIAKSANSTYVALIVIALLFADIFVAMPTLTIIMLSGYFLGPIVGALASIAGLFFAGVSGYGVSRRYGHAFIRILVKEKAKREEVSTLFMQHGAVVVLLSRATPILPEVSACMSGMTRMPFLKFILLWLLSTVPYAAIATYAGSVSSLENPNPAIFTAIGLTLLFWLGWFLFKRSQQ